MCLLSHYANLKYMLELTIILTLSGTMTWHIFHLVQSRPMGTIISDFANLEGSNFVDKYSTGEEDVWTLSQERSKLG